MVLLAGCASNPDGSYDDRDCRPDSIGMTAGSSGNPLADLAVALVLDITWFAGCEAAVGVANGIHNFHRALTHDGIYYSPDGLFSVAVPGGPGADEYQVQQQSRPDKDTVLFIPRHAEEPAYGITALPRLQDADAALSLDAFAEEASAKLPGIGDDAGGNLIQVHAEDVQLGAYPARFIEYRSAAGPDTFYLLYFLKTSHAAVILTITWQQRCPLCSAASEAQLRGMDPGLDAFVSSFEFANKGD